VTYLIIGIVVALALAPLLQFLPSRRQRHLARLREVAAVSGLFVEFRPVPGADRLPGVNPGTVIYYGRRLPAAAAGRVERATWLWTEEGWRALGARAPVPAALASLPPGILAAGVDQGSCGVYWQESGSEETVAQIVDVLRAWCDAFAG